MRGSCIHRVLERDARRARAGRSTPGHARRRRDRSCERIVGARRRRSFVLAPRRRRAGGRGARDRRRPASATCAHEARGGGAFEPAELELRFGLGEDTLPALVLGGRRRAAPARRDRPRRRRPRRPRARARLQERPARPTWAVAKWAGEDQLQVALYMLAVRELLGLEPVGGVYQPLRGDDLRARGVVRDDVDAGRRRRRHRPPHERRAGRRARRAPRRAPASWRPRLRAGDARRHARRRARPGGCALPGDLPGGRTR